MEPSFSQGNGNRKGSWMSQLVQKNHRILAWLGFALWILTMYAVLFRMTDLF